MSYQDPAAGGRQPTEEELRAAMEEQMRRIRVQDVLLQTAATLVNLGGRRLGLAPDAGDERDLEQARLAIEGVRALVPLLGAEEAGLELLDRATGEWLAIKPPEGAMVVNVGMWLERFVIVVTSLHRDFLPSSWGMYWPTRWDIMTFVGTIGLFITLFFLFIRVLPMISIFEMRTMVPDAEVKGSKGH